ncbi:MAG: flagellar biosynthetic protein FliO [Christensenellales bacterium]
MGDNDWYTLFIILIMVAVMVGAYFTTKFLSGKAGRMIKSKHIKVIDRVALAKDKALFLTKVGGKCFFIGVTNQTINNISEIDLSELNIVSEDAADVSSKNFFGRFSDFLASAKNAPENLRKAKNEYKQTKNQTAEPAKTGVDDDYADQISRAIEQRREKAGKKSGGAEGGK